MEHTKGEIGYKWPLHLVTKPISWVHQIGTMTAIFDSNDDLVAVLPQAQAEYIFAILNSHDKLVALCRHVAETAGMDMAIKILSEIDNRKHAGISIVLQGIQDFAKAALAEGD